MDAAVLLLAAIVALAFIAQSMTGFGAVLIALTLGAQLYPVQELVPVLVALVFPHSAWLIWKHHPHIDWRLLGREVLPLMLLLLPLGVWMAATLDAVTMKRLLGVLVLFVSGRELLRLSKGEQLVQKLPQPLFLVWIAAAGLVQGMFGTGGPLLVYALSRHGLDKHVFRASLLVVWPILNTVLIALLVWRGAWSSATSWLLLCTLPAIPVGVLLGEMLHRRVSERTFSIAIQCLLLVAALVLLFSS